MGTRSNIGILNENNTVTKIYCHWDGYPEGVGAVLKAHYTEEAKVRALMAFGDLSSIGASLPTQRLIDVLKQLDDDQRYAILGETDIVCPYGLWRGEKCPSKVVTLAGFKKDNGDGAEYKYLFDPTTNTWKTYEM